MSEYARRLKHEIAEAEAKLACYIARWDVDYESRKRSEYWRGVRDGLRAAETLATDGAVAADEREGAR